MSSQAEIQTQWEAFLKLLQVREPKLFDHVKKARPKEMTKYNLMVYAKTAEDLKEIEVGLKVYHDKIAEFTAMIFGEGRGLKTELASEEDWKRVEPAPGPAPAAAVPAAQPVLTVAADQNELLKVLESSIRQKLEMEIRAALQAEALSPEAQAQLASKLKDDIEQEDENRRLAVRMALVAEGDQILTQLVMAWQQAKQTGDGGAPWNEVKQRLLELLDATVQLTHS